MTANTAAALKAQFDLHTRLFNNVFEGIEDNEANTRNGEHVNHMKWVAGHLLNTRVDSLTKLTGGTPDTSYSAQFGRGATLDANAAYPAIEEIKAKWNDVSTSVSEGFNQLPEEFLSSKAPAGAPISDDTFRGLLAFLVSHEAYHIGQLSILRKLAGKDAMSYR